MRKLETEFTINFGFIKLQSKRFKRKKQLFRPPQIGVIMGVLFTGIIVATLYMLLDILSPYDENPCNPLICTPGYPCFEQGDYTHMGGE